MNPAVKCGCTYSLAAVCGLFAAIAVVLWLASDRCLDAGGRVSDTAWVCESASGAVGLLWSLVTPGIAALAVLIGVVIYFAVASVGRRWLLR